MAKVNEDFMDRALEALEKEIINGDTSMYGYDGEIGESTNQMTYLKGMSDAGVKDNELGYKLSVWLSNNNVKHQRYDGRRLKIHTGQLQEALLKKYPDLVKKD